MKYVSDDGKIYNSVEECEAADKALAELKEKEKAEKEALAAKKEALAKERATRAKEVEDALKAVKDAEDNYHKLLTEFLKDYKQYHCTYTSSSPFPSMFSIFDDFFKF